MNTAALTSDFSPNPFRLKLCFVSRGHAFLALLGAVFITFSCAGFTCAADLYASDITSGTILKIGPNGAPTTFSSVSTPRGLAFDLTGNLYVGDVTTQSVIKFTPTGVGSTFATGFTTPSGLAFDSAGNLYVTDIGTNLIRKITPAGAQSTFASGLNRPADLAFNKIGDLFEVDRNSGMIIKFTGGTPSTFATGLNLPAGIACDSINNVFVVEQGTNLVLKYAPNGTHVTFATIAGGDAPVRLAIDTADNVYLSVLLSTGGANIYKYAPAGGAPVTFATTIDTIGFIALGQPLKLTSVSRVGLGPVVVEGIGAPSVTYTLKAASDPSQPFTYLTSSTSDNAGHLHFEDANAASFSKRFYRITYP